MSTRTHAPECAKTHQLKAYEENGPERTPVTASCTCSAEYQPSVEERLTQHEREHAKMEHRLTDAREYAERWRDRAEELKPGHAFVGLPWEDDYVQRPSLEERMAHAEHDRETLEKLENAFEAVGGDLVDEVLGLRGSVTEAMAQSERYRRQYTGSRYELASVRERLAQAERERDEARDRADELRVELGGLLSNAELWRRWPHPWEESNG